MQEMKLSLQNREALADIKKFIEENQEKIPSIRQLSRRCGLNQDKLKKGFKLLFGLPPYRYHLKLKMERAKKLLLETDQAVYEIAWSLGYEHSSNFCTEFKRFTGMRPVLFRQDAMHSHERA